MSSKIPKRHSLQSLSSAFGSEIVFFLSSVHPDNSHRFRNRSLRYEDCYRKGLDGSQAAWASRRYRSHRALPPEASKEMVLELMKHTK